MDAIGGYFELELRKGEHYHKDALKLNTARNCFEYVLRARGYKKVYMPYYTCDVMFQPLNKLGVDYSFYHIDERFEICELPTLKDGDAILYTNYFALKQSYVESLARIYGSTLIVDNAQAFYAPRVNGIDTFYSARKFFGVPDGAYLYTDCYLDDELEQDVSWERMTHLLKRIEFGAEAGYDDFRKVEESLDNQPIKRMSKLTESILENVDYEAVALKRRENYLLFVRELTKYNKLNIRLSNESVPMVYPYYTENTNTLLKSKLIQNRIFIPTYWAYINTKDSMLEERLSERLLPLPVDQRDIDIDRILKIIKI